jgi:hypothetical protein
MALKHFLGGMALVAAAVCAFPIANGFGAAPSETSAYGVNRAAKSDRLVVPVSVVAKRKVPVQRVREPSESAKRKLMDGCEPMFSPVTVPSAAHISGRCVG